MRWLWTLPFLLLFPHAVRAEALIFAEDFSSGPAALDAWSMKDPSHWTVTSEGHLASSPPPDLNIVGCASPRFSPGNDRSITFAFLLQEGTEIAFKVNYAGGGHLFRLIINSRGFLLRINTNRNIPITTPLNLERFAGPIAPGQWHQMTMTMKGTQVHVSLRGVGEMTYENDLFAHPVGTIGLSANGSNVLIDQLRITATTKSTDPDPPSSEELSQDWLAAIDPFLDAHCFDCHDDTVAKAGLDLFTLSTDLRDAETLRKWVRIFDRVEKGEMPPPQKPRPESSSKAQFLADLQQPLLAGHRSQREVVLRRLNRLEYETTINDLFGIDAKAGSSFPADAKKHGFDNNGEGLTLSSELIQLYLEAAHVALDRAFGPPEAPKRFHYDGHIRPLIGENMYVRWEKLIGDERGTILYSSNPSSGSQLARLKLPEEGTYRFRFQVSAYQSEEPVMMQVQTGILKREGEKRFIGFYEIPPEGRIVEFTDYMIPGESVYPRPFGTIKNIKNFTVPDPGRSIHEYEGAGLLISGFEVEGPLEEWPPPSRSLLLGQADLSTATAEDAKEIFARFLPRAFRRPVSPEETDRYVSKTKELMSQGRSFEGALRWGLTAALCSAEFLFLEEPATSNQKDRIVDFALASRLSYFLWSSMPDEELFDLAAAGQLRDSAVLRSQVERLLSSPKSRALTTNFAHQWLHLRDIDATSPDTNLFPSFDEYLKLSMVQESESFFDIVLRENRPIHDFIDSDWIMINQRLADHYEIPHVQGSQFRPVSLPSSSPRGGIMTQASVLKVTANGANTSPITRGVWILENLLGIHPPPPPPGIPAVVPDVTGANTLRQLLETHRNEESCQGCHRLIDPPGFALESFDPIGAWRTKYRFQGSKRMLPVDPTGETNNGQPFQDIHQYKEILLQEIDQVTYGLAEKLLTYGTGRAMGFSDRHAIQEVVTTVSQSGYGFQDLIHAVVQSPPFRQP